MQHDLLILHDLNVLASNAQVIRTQAVDVIAGQQIAVRALARKVARSVDAHLAAAAVRGAALVDIDALPVVPVGVGKEGQLVKRSIRIRSI